MSANSKFCKDFKIRKNYLLYERKSHLLKFFAFSNVLTTHFRSYCFFKLLSLRSNYSRTRMKNRCLFTGRSRGIMRKFKVSRIQFKKLASEDLIPGLTKSSF